jgi:hypothetical protein
MTKKIACLLLSALFLFCTGAFSVSATERTSPAEDIAPSTPTRLSYTNMTATGLKIVSGTATCTASIEGYPHLTTSVKIEMTLQKRFLLFFWSDQATWTQAFPTYYGTLQKTYPVSSGTYRTYAVYTAYSGSASETTSGHSSDVVY